MDKSEENTHFEGLGINPKDVRKIANKMNVPNDIPLPEVIIIGENSKIPDDYVDTDPKEYPLLHTTAKDDNPSGYFITIPERMLKKINGDNFILGNRARENIRHELAHYLEHIETGTTAGREDEPYNAATKEIRADLRAGRKDLSRCLAIVIRTLVRDYGLSANEANDVVEKAARDYGISSRTINRAKQRYREADI